VSVGLPHQVYIRRRDDREKARPPWSQEDLERWQEAEKVEVHITPAVPNRVLRSEVDGYEQVLIMVSRISNCIAGCFFIADKLKSNRTPIDAKLNRRYKGRLMWFFSVTLFQSCA
jgi:hypothetical protein